MFQPKQKIELNEGRTVTDGNITYGGFPKILNEAKKLAKKDYNKNGVLESPEKEYLGARDKAIKANMGKKVEESFDATDFEVVEELLEELFDENELDLIIEAAEKKKWIQKAIKKEGSLRKTLKVKKGEKIPEKKLEAATKKGGKTGKRARLAMTLKKLNEETEGDWTKFIGLVNQAQKAYFSKMPGTPGKRTMPPAINRHVENFINDPSKGGDVGHHLIQAGFPADLIGQAEKIRISSINKQKNSQGKADPSLRGSYRPSYDRNASASE